VNKVPRKKGYVPNKYTGRSMMYNGGKKKMQMGGSTSSKVKGPLGPVDTSAISKKKKPIKMNMGGMGGGRQMYGHGGKAMKSDIYAMEDACNKMAGYNMSLPKGR